MSESFKNYITGQWVAPLSGRYFRNTNPADVSHCLGEFPRSNAKDVDTAVSSARSALKSWRRTPAPQRGEWIAKIGELIQYNKERLAQTITQENGKILKEARGDVQEAVNMACFMAVQGRLLEGQTYPSEIPNRLCMTLRRPVGVCGLITPWNFPIAIPAWKLFPALISGNTVIWKPAEDTPLSAHLLMELMLEAGIPPGVINLVQGIGEEAGRTLVDHPGVDLISFTGSSETGREVAEKCGKTLKRCSLEMGGKNAQIILKDADLDRAVDGALRGAFGTTGQRCTATSRLIVEKEVLPDFTEKLLNRIKKIKMGNGLEEMIDLGPLINKTQREKVHAYVTIGQKEGAHLLYGGQYHEEGPCSKGTFYKPTLFDSVHPKMRIAQEEIFGPVTALIETSNVEEAISIVNNTQYGLSASIYTRDIDKALYALEEIETGMTYINCPTVGSEIQLPFGGLKNTGNGHREAGLKSLDTFTEWKSAYLSYQISSSKAGHN
jgi:alpha-ketoglutaric semialdehyde dehydrogenase